MMSTRLVLVFFLFTMGGVVLAVGHINKDADLIHLKQNLSGTAPLVEQDIESNTRTAYVDEEGYTHYEI